MNTSSGTALATPWPPLAPADSWRPIGAVLAGVLAAVGSGAPWPPPGSGTGL